VIRQLAVIHHLQQDVEYVRMRFFDLIEKQHAMWVLINAISQQPALIKPDIARRRTDQTRDRVFFHIFGHVKTDQLDTKRVSKLLCNFGFTNAGWTREEIVANRLFRLT